MKHHGLIHQMQSDQYKPVFLYHQLSLPMYYSLWLWTKDDYHTDCQSSCSHWQWQWPI